MRIWGTKLPMVSRTYNNLNIEQTTSFLLPLPHVHWAFILVRINRKRRLGLFDIRLFP